MKKKQNNTSDPLRGMRQTGAITYQGQRYDIYLDKKGGLLFVKDGSPVDDNSLQDALMKYLLQANKES